MHVLTSGTPLTNGEVYALVRRRRDERSAELHPPFGLQHVQADTQSRASSHYGPAGRLLPAHIHGSVGNSTSSAEASRLLLSSPSSAHLIVLLTEVRLLNYLANHAHLTSSKDGALRSIYGPSTVYAQQQQHRSTLRKVGLGSEGGDPDVWPGEKCCLNSSEALVSSKCEASDDKSACTDTRELRCEANQDDVSSVKKWKEIIMQNRAGTPEHIHAVQQILTHYEQQGYQQEKNWAHKIRVYVEAFHFASPHKTVKFEPSDANEESWNASSGVPSSLIIPSAAEARPANTANVRPLLSAPQKIYADTVSAYASSSPSQDAYSSFISMHHEGFVAESLFLTQQELIQLVVGRPRNSLEVYRLLDNLTERFGSDEEAALGFVDFISDVFDTSNEKGDKELKGQVK
ncbi:unnamed protein product [Phytomonas sp. EM1]|nr:unnamed protein product [Phytomonas sp. EM1]|eukprot:CCW61457.1 unnamed protein product [Phytomonas sp. isolate EM1]